MILKIMALQNKFYGGIRFSANMQFMFTKIDSQKSI